jgi:hypothetical protein
LVAGFAALGDRAIRMEEAEVTVENFGLALGFYFWPRAWSGHGKGAAGGDKVTFDLALRERKTFANWVIGGFAMGIVTGEVNLEGRIWNAYGFGEIIK